MAGLVRLPMSKSISFCVYGSGLLVVADRLKARRVEYRFHPTRFHDWLAGWLTSWKWLASSADKDDMILIRQTPICNEC